MCLQYNYRTMFWNNWPRASIPLIPGSGGLHSHYYMVAEGFIPIEARCGHRLASVSVTGDFSNKRHLDFPERASMGMKPAASMGMKSAATAYLWE